MTNEKEVQVRAVARTISLTTQEWKELQRQASKWKTSRSGAIRRIWLEWEQCKSQAAAGAGLAGQGEEAA